MHEIVRAARRPGSGGGGEAEAAAQVRCHFAMARQAEGAEVIDIALAAALGYRQDVIGVPERAAAGDELHAVQREACGSAGPSRALEGVIDGDGIGSAEGADAVIAGEDLVAEVAGIGAQTPLVDAEVRAEGASTTGQDLKVAPAAEGEPIGTFGQGGGFGAAAGEGAGFGILRGHGMRVA